MDIEKARQLLTEPVVQSVAQDVPTNTKRISVEGVSMDAAMTLAQLGWMPVENHQIPAPLRFVLPENLVDYPDDSPYHAIFLTQCAVAASGYEAMVGALAANVYECEPRELPPEGREHVRWIATPMLPQTVAVNVTFVLASDEFLEPMHELVEKRPAGFSPDALELLTLILNAMRDEDPKHEKAD